MLVQCAMLALALGIGAADKLPPLSAKQIAEYGLKYTEPAKTWDEGLPLGNGTLGALVWGDGGPLNISIDRTDLWDLRPVSEFHSPDYRYATMREWEKAGKYDELKALYEDPYDKAGPTRLPAGRITIGVSGLEFREATLDITEGHSRTRFGDNGSIEVWIHAERPVGFIRIQNVPEAEVRLVPPAFSGEVPEDEKPGISAGSLARLGYPEPKITSGDNWQAYEQEGFGGLRIAAYLSWQQVGDSTFNGAWSVARSWDGSDPMVEAMKEVRMVMGPDRQAIDQEHAQWWRKYWNQAWISIPDPMIERQYYLDLYKFGCAARRGAPPISLQGPWTADDGKLPPWKGDYHHDLNTEMSYWLAYTGNRLDESMGFTDWLWSTRENCMGWTQYFYRLPGLNVPMSGDLLNNQLGGWRQYTHSATTAAWLAQHFYLQWQYTRDEAFLRERAYPWLHDTAIFLRAITTERDADGKRTLPLSSSPEIHDNKPEAWFPTITNYDNALIQWVFSKAAELAEAVGETDEAQAWRDALAEMPQLAVGKEGLLVAADTPLEESHRHFSHLMAFHPLALVDWNSGDEARALVQRSLEHMEKLGTKKWIGFSFAWWANMLARAHKGDAAAHALHIFSSAFTLRNSFHCNGDQSGEGHSDYSYRPFTLEGNFGAAAAVHEMLLQSQGGFIDVFPALPPSWKNVRFAFLRAQGGFVVSAALEDGAWALLQVVATVDGPCRIRSPKDGKIVEIDLKRGEGVLWKDGEFVAMNGR
ncbi:MAG: hypothetical protein GC168_18850 [Candidatus Hydrogenedens sp.]|nr:hypothetical protein [Candidatus Hydrogenedens sp.]